MHLTEPVFLHIPKKTFCPRSLLREQNHPGSLQCSFESGWNTVLIWWCRPHCRTNSHRAQVNILSWNNELILNLDSEDCTNPTAAHVSSDPFQTVVLCVHNFTMETSKLHLKLYFLLSTHCIIQMQGRAPVLHVLLNAALTSLSDCWRKKVVQENFITPEAQVNSVHPIKPTSASAGGRPSASCQLTERKRRQILMPTTSSCTPQIWYAVNYWKSSATTQLERLIQASCTAMETS